MVEDADRDAQLTLSSEVRWHAVDARDLIRAGGAVGVRTDELTVHVAVVEIVDRAKMKLERLAAEGGRQIELLAEPDHAVVSHPKLLPKARKAHLLPARVVEAGLFVAALHAQIAGICG